MIALFVALLIFNTVFFAVLLYLYFLIHDDVKTMRSEYLKLMEELNSDSKEIHRHNGEIIAKWTETIDTLNELLDLIRQAGMEGVQE